MLTSRTNLGIQCINSVDHTVCYRDISNELEDDTADDFQSTANDFQSYLSAE